jgi:hypothetical protein
MIRSSETASASSSGPQGPDSSSIRKSPRGQRQLGLDPQEAAKRLDKRCRETTGFSLFDFRPQAYGAGVSVPTLMAQLRRDFLIHGEKDGQEIFDLACGIDQGDVVDRSVVPALLCLQPLWAAS